MVPYLYRMNESSSVGAGHTCAMLLPIMAASCNAATWGRVVVLLVACANGMSVVQVVVRHWRASEPHFIPGPPPLVLRRAGHRTATRLGVDSSCQCATHPNLWTSFRDVHPLSCILPAPTMQVLLCELRPIVLSEVSRFSDSNTRLLFCSAL
jgi:hypothetical protein